MPRQREPRTIDEARAFLVGLLPVGWSMQINVLYYDSREAERMASSVRYSVCLGPIRSHGSTQDCHASGHDPASLCRAAIAAIRTRVDLRALPAPALPAVKPNRRLSHKQQPLRLT